jgi:hypothetical protein
MSCGWTGESVKHDDDSDQECFRKYDNPSESFKITRYFNWKKKVCKSFDFSKGDYKAWAEGLKLLVCHRPLSIQTN